MVVQIQMRRDTAADWTAADPTLAEGEIGIETDTGKMKIGDGATAWTLLAYGPAGTAINVDDTAGGTDGATTDAASSNVMYDHANANTGVHGIGGSTFATAATLAAAFLWAIPASDHTYTGFAVTRTAGTNLTIGQVCYMGSDGKMELADADAAATMPVLYMATGTIAENAAGAFLAIGCMRDDTWNWATVGGVIYADTVTAGGMTQTRPSGAGDQVQILGYAWSADVVWFNPCPVIVEI